MSARAAGRTSRPVDADAPMEAPEPVADVPRGRVQVPRSRPGKRLGVPGRLRYWRRVASAYLGGRASHLTFWHGTPEVNEAADPAVLDQYWQKFHVKADYPGPFDGAGIPLLDYHGHVGLQHNPIAIAQYGLGNYNLWRDGGEPERRARFLSVADWLVETLVRNEAGLAVWRHPFRWEYQTLLPEGWYSALSQGQGISLLVRAHAVTAEARYLEAAQAAFETFFHEMEDGGVVHTDGRGYVWFEEVIVHPPTHILNGMLWASWGMYDLWLHTGDVRAKERWESAVRTLADNLDAFDVGYWSLYDEAGTPLPNAASRFYHALHVVQLRVMDRLSGEPRFAEVAARWDAFQGSGVRRRAATAHKALFKILYY